jgi:hypothetical protein
MKEVTGLVPNTANRVDLWTRLDGVTRWCDLIVSDPAAPTYVVGASTKQGHAAGLAESQKLSKWKKLAPPSVTIQPLAMETTGLVGKAMKDFLRAMEKATTGGPRRTVLMTQLSVTCVRFGVAMVREAASKWR